MIWPCNIGVPQPSGSVTAAKSLRKRGQPKWRPRAFLTGTPVALAVCLVAGCAFNLVRVPQVPMTFTPVTEHKAFVLREDVKANLGTSYPTRLRSGTGWNLIGLSDLGEIFATTNQIVTVEESHIYEADLVISNSLLTGFRLRREGTFVPVTRALPLSIQPLPQP